LAQESKESAEALARQEETERKKREIERRQTSLQTRMNELKAEYDADAKELEMLIAQDRARGTRVQDDIADMARSRKVSSATSAAGEIKSRRAGVRK
jgi:circadian clock protein KaiC